MSTRARIGIVRPDGSILSIYTHYDGYISHHGPILLEHYGTAQKVLALIKKGDCSQLNETLDDCHFYGRDREETCVSARTSKSLALYYRCARQSNAEYAYLFYPDKQQWHVSEVRPTPGFWQDLRTATITERLTA